MTGSWRCYSADLPAPIAVPCDAHGTGTWDACQDAAQQHTETTRHPTMAGMG